MTWLDEVPQITAGDYFLKKGGWGYEPGNLYVFLTTLSHVARLASFRLNRLLSNSVGKANHLYGAVTTLLELHGPNTTTSLRHNFGIFVCRSKLTKILFNRKF